MDREEWSRHYDSVHWTQITVFTGVVAILVGYSIGKDFSPWLSFLGLWMTNLTLYLTASFREYRRELALGIQDEEALRFLTNQAGVRGLPMWPAFVLTFVLLDALWLKGFWEQRGTWQKCLAGALTAASIGVVLYVYHRGRPPKYEERVPHGKTTVS